MTAALETAGLGKRYGSRWALQGCSFSLQPGQVAALVGPNGAGKSTLLNIAVGLARPTTGTARLFGHDPINEARAVLPMVGFVGQDRPLYRGFSIGEMLTFGAKLNPAWDQGFAEARIRQLGLDLEKKVGQLSGGQQAQVALVLAMAKQPRILLLDEPIAAFDPLARRDFFRLLMEVVSDRETTVLLSSHILGDLERVCDSLIVLLASKVALEGELDDILARHRLVVGPAQEKGIALMQHTVLSRSETDRQVSMLVRLECPLVLSESWTAVQPSLEDIVLAYMEFEASGAQRELVAAR